MLILGVLGVAAASGLAMAARRFAVQVDPRVDRVQGALPGANCGACGCAGCSAYAEAVVAGAAPPGQCTPGGESVAKEVADIMGVQAEAKEKEVAVLLCRGRDVPARFHYDGLPDCRAAALLQDGPKACAYGCLGFGTCAAVCPFGAVKMVDGLPQFDAEICVGCGLCVKVCPRNIIAVRPITHYVHVLCNSHDKGAAVKKLCESGCIGCKKCEKVCKFDAIKVENFLATIDYEKCRHCAACVKECPTGVIVNFRRERPQRAKQAKAPEQSAVA